MGQTTSSMNLTGSSEHLKSITGPLSEISDKYLTDPVVGMIGIGDYDPVKGVNYNLDGIPADYQSIIHVFSKIYNYKVLVNRDDNNEFQTRWTYDQIKSFRSKVRIECETKKHDGLIFIISCHGTEKNMIYDSQWETFPLEKLFNYFNGDACDHLIGKPKIFIIDSCRGNDRSLPLVNPQVSQNVNSSSISGNGFSVNGINYKPKNISNEESDKFYHCDSNFCFIFANTEGNRTFDTDKAGGLLIQSVSKVFNHRKFIECNDLDRIIRQIRRETKLVSTTIARKAKYSTTQIVENRSTMEDSLFFKIKSNIPGGIVLPDAMRNPLVVLICITEHDRWNSRAGYAMDMEMQKNLWQNEFGFHVITNKGSENKNGKSGRNGNSLKYSLSLINLKKELKNAQTILIQNKSNFDGLIFYYSGWYSSNDIITTDDKYFAFSNIKQYFSPQEIPQFKDKPKIYIMMNMFGCGKSTNDPFNPNKNKQMNVQYHPFCNTLDIFANPPGYGFFYRSDSVSYLCEALYRQLKEYANDLKESNSRKKIQTWYQLLTGIKRDVHSISNGYYAAQYHDSLLSMISLDINRNYNHDNLNGRKKTDKKMLTDDSKESKETSMNQDIINIPKCNMKCPLVVVVGISKYNYKNASWTTIPQVKKSKILLENLWQNKYGFYVISNESMSNTFDKQKKNVKKNKSNNNNNEKNMDYVTENDLKQLLTFAQNEIKNQNVDGLIFCYCGLEYKNGIITSDGEKVSLRTIKRYFSPDKVPKLKDQPKIYILDTCACGEDSGWWLGVSPYKDNEKNGMFRYYHYSSNTLDIFANTADFIKEEDKDQLQSGNLMTKLLVQHLEDYVDMLKKCNLENDNININGGDEKTDENEKLDSGGGSKLKTFEELLMTLKVELHKKTNGEQILQYHDTLLSQVFLSYCNPPWSACTNDE